MAAVEKYCVGEWGGREAIVRETEGRFLEWDHALLPPDACQDPLAQPDPGFLTLDGPARVDGLDSTRDHTDDADHNGIAQGRIVDGLLTTEPVDLRLKIKQQTQDNAIYLRDARIRAKVLADGRIEGTLGAYWDNENFWSMMNDHWIGDRHQGRNAAFNRGFMCAGLYHAIPRVADGHPDPETGRCTSMSTALHFEARPAFVIRPTLVAADAR